jgi:hypothetical protein
MSRTVLEICESLRHGLADVANGLERAKQRFEVYSTKCDEVQQFAKNLAERNVDSAKRILALTKQNIELTQQLEHRSTAAELRREIANERPRLRIVA